MARTEGPRQAPGDKSGDAHRPRAGAASLPQLLTDNELTEIEVAGRRSPDQGRREPRR